MEVHTNDLIISIPNSVLKIAKHEDVVNERFTLWMHLWSSKSLNVKPEEDKNKSAPVRITP
jgi:hypothetical protein